MYLKEVEWMLYFNEHWGMPNSTLLTNKLTTWFMSCWNDEKGHRVFLEI
jgi:hypothetical protein